MFRRGIFIVLVILFMGAFGCNENGEGGGVQDGTIENPDNRGPGGYVPIDGSGTTEDENDGDEVISGDGDEGPGEPGAGDGSNPGPGEPGAGGGPGPGDSDGPGSVQDEDGRPPAIGCDDSISVKEGSEKSLRARLNYYDGTFEWSLGISEACNGHIKHELIIDERNRVEVNILGLNEGGCEITLVAKLSETQEITKIVSIEVTPSPIEITMEMQEALLSGEEYNLSLTATGGTGRYIWSEVVLDAETGEETTGVVTEIIEDGSRFKLILRPERPGPYKMRITAEDADRVNFPDKKGEREYVFEVRTDIAINPYRVLPYIDGMSRFERPLRKEGGTYIVPAGRAIGIVVEVVDNIPQDYHCTVVDDPSIVAIDYNKKIHFGYMEMFAACILILDPQQGLQEDIRLEDVSVEVRSEHTIGTWNASSILFERDRCETPITIDYHYDDTTVTTGEEFRYEFTVSGGKFPYRVVGVDGESVDIVRGPQTEDVRLEVKAERFPRMMDYDKFAFEGVVKTRNRITLEDYINRDWRWVVEAQIEDSCARPNTATARLRIDIDMNKETRFTEEEFDTNLVLVANDTDEDSRLTVRLIDEDKDSMAWWRNGIGLDQYGDSAHSQHEGGCNDFGNSRCKFTVREPAWVFDVAAVKDVKKIKEVKFKVIAKGNDILEHLDIKFYAFEIYTSKWYGRVSAFPVDIECGRDECIQYYDITWYRKNDNPDLEDLIDNLF